MTTTIVTSIELPTETNSNNCKLSIFRENVVEFTCFHIHNDEAATLLNNELNPILKISTTQKKIGAHADCIKPLICILEVF